MVKLVLKLHHMSPEGDKGKFLNDGANVGALS